MMQTLKKQRGVINLTAIIIVLAVVAAVIGFIGYQQSQLRSLESDLSTAKGEVKKGNETINNLSGVNKSLQNTITTMKNLETIQQGEVKSNNDAKATVDNKTNEIIKKLPKAKPKASEPIDTPDDAKVLAERAQALWDAYCLADSSNLQCKEVVK